MTKYSDLDTVIINAGIQNILPFKDADTGAPEAITKEVTTNFTAPIILCQALVPYFLNAKNPCNIILISSGLAFVPAPFAPVYCSTKAALHAFSLRFVLSFLETISTSSRCFGWWP